MKYLYILVAILFLTACKKEEVEPQVQNTEPTPPPAPIIELNCHFIADINGANYEITQNVNGYNGLSLDSLYLVPSPSLSEAVYHFRMSSTSSAARIEIKHGSILFDYATTSSPTLNQFNNFFANDTIPSYSSDGISGFEVVFTDNLGAEWKSNPTSVNPQTVQMQNVLSESGSNGDFVKFDCAFNCYVYNVGYTDSIFIDNAVIQGWYQF